MFLGKKSILMRVTRLRASSRHGGSGKFLRFSLADPPLGRPFGAAAFILSSNYGNTIRHHI